MRKTKAKPGFKKCFCSYVRCKSGEEIMTNGLRGTLTANAGKNEALGSFCLSVSTDTVPRWFSPKAWMKKWMNSSSRGHSAPGSPRKSCLIQFHWPEWDLSEGDWVRWLMTMWGHSVPFLKGCGAWGRSLMIFSASRRHLMILWFPGLHQATLSGAHNLGNTACLPGSLQCKVPQALPTSQHFWLALWAPLIPPTGVTEIFTESWKGLG